MMKLNFFVLTFFTSVLFSQSQHVPPCDGLGHGSGPGSICYGYAMGRAFGTTWNSGICPASTLRNFNQINPTFFDLFSYTHYNLHAGDIVAWGLSHVAFVEYTDNPITSESSIHISQVEYQGATEVHAGTLAEVRAGNSSKGVGIIKYYKNCWTILFNMESLHKFRHPTSIRNLFLPIHRQLDY